MTGRSVVEKKSARKRDNSSSGRTHATLLLQAGVPPKVVSERLGHATVAFTKQVYAHVIPGMQADAASAFGNLVFLDDENGPLRTDRRRISRRVALRERRFDR